MTRMRGTFPFLYDDDDRLIGLSQPGGVEEFFSLIRVGTTAPVDGVKAAITTDMTNANADITLTADEYGSDGNFIDVVYLDPGANDQSLFVWVDILAKLISVSLATGAGGAITSTANEVKTALDADAQIAALVDVSVEGTGLGVVNAKAEAALAGGVTCTLGAYPNGMYYDSTTQEFYRKLGEQTWSIVTSGGGVISYSAITADYTVTVADSFLDIDATAGTVDITLPAVADVPAGRTFQFKASNVDNLITIDGNGAETIDGAASITMPGLNSSRRLISTGTEWKVW